MQFRSSSLSKNKNYDECCFLWSILAKLHPCNNDHPNRVSNYRQNFNALNIECFDFSKGFKCNDVQTFEKVSILFINIFELNYYLDQIEGKHKLFPIEVSRNETDRVVDLQIYRTHYVLIKKLIVFLGKQVCRFIFKRCLCPYTSQGVLIIQMEKCGQQKKLLKNLIMNLTYIEKIIFIRIH